MKTKINIGKGIVLSCFDKTTNMVKPWANQGFKCQCVDLQHPFGTTTENNNIFKIHADMLEWKPDFDIFNKYKIAFFFPPCTDVAVSGARWFKDKGLGAVINALQLFKVCVDIASILNIPYMIENPVSTVSTYWRKPDYIFQPWEYGDLYTKKTCLWVGNGFVMPEPIYKEKPEGVTEKIWLMPPSEDRANKRSETPMGFANAVFKANR